MGHRACLPACSLPTRSFRLHPWQIVSTCINTASRKMKSHCSTWPSLSETLALAFEQTLHCAVARSSAALGSASRRDATTWKRATELDIVNSYETSGNFRYATQLVFDQ